GLLPYTTLFPISEKTSRARGRARELEWTWRLLPGGAWGGPVAAPRSSLAPGSEGAVGEVVVRRVLRRDERAVEDVAAEDRHRGDEVEGGDLHRGRDHRRRVEDVDGHQRVAVHDALDDLLHAGAADHEHLVLAVRLAQRLDHAQGDVVVLRPHRVDLGEAGEEVLHDLEAVVAVPVRVLAVEDL